ncbi:MAG: hypothetical protein K6F23_06265 [Solobacterium sp.]|nr:hypothetical protein [Solobacterium sp.]
MFNCPECGGSLVFDIQSQQLKCLHCSSEIPVEEYHTANHADEDSDSFGAAVYRCPNCSAEIIAPDEASTGFCSYCGYEAVLKGRMSREQRPRYIIPFQLSKEDCRTKFRWKTHVPYLPKEFRNEEFLEKFRGIYIPYWMYEVGYNDPIILNAEKQYRKGNYQYTEKYDVSVDLKGKTYGIPYDASKGFDDRVADELAPFKKEDLKDFREEYLAGFYADRPTVRPEIYSPEAEDLAADRILDQVDDMLEYNMSLSRTEEAMKKRINAEAVNSDTALFPVWFLTWRDHNRVAYSIMNGQTGKLSFDVPVDVKKVLIGSLLTAFLVYFGLDKYIAVTAITALFFVSLCTPIIANMIRAEAEKVFIRENHLHDKGYGVIDGKKAGLVQASAAHGIGVFIAIAAAAFVWVGEARVSSMIILLLADLYMAYWTIRYSASISRKAQFILPALFTALIPVMAAVIYWIDPVSDLNYYAVIILALIVMLYSCVSLILNYNLSATRPIPNFTERKGGDDSEKDY